MIGIQKLTFEAILQGAVFCKHGDKILLVLDGPDEFVKIIGLIHIRDRFYDEKLREQGFRHFVTSMNDVVFYIGYWIKTGRSSAE